jgi:hypothetical protein
VASLAGGGDGPVGVGEGQRHGLFAVDCLARASRRLDQVGMGAGRGGDHHRVDGRLGEQLAGVGQRLGAAQPVR